MSPESSRQKAKKSSSKKHRDRKEDKKRKRQHEVIDDEPTSKKHRSERFEDPQTNVQPPEPAPPASLSTPFVTKTCSMYLPLSPISQLRPLEGLCAEHLSPLLLTYYRPLGGVVLSYSNPRLSERPSSTSGKTNEPALALSINEYGPGYVWATADFLLFKPRRGQIIEGWINLQNESHLGLICWNLFNASIERRRLPRNWTWSGVGGRTYGKNGPQAAQQSMLSTEADERGQGTFIDGDGRKVEGVIRFKIIDIETAYSYGKGFLTIEGALLNGNDEAQLAEGGQSGPGQGQRATVVGRETQPNGLARSGSGSIGDGNRMHSERRNNTIN
ncbi:MAG: hypothetical protein M1815_002665 [Lichina confinis]|nr:MAG: hypothetical protein M1815_002665 [Lichina confinis]